MKDYSAKNYNSINHSSEKEQRLETKPLLQQIKQIYIIFLYLIVISFVCGAAYTFVERGLTTELSINIKGITLLNKKVLLQEMSSLVRNFFTTDVYFVEQSLLQNPWIKSAKARKFLPYGLEVLIQERVPIATVSLKGETYLIDRDFVLFPLKDKKLSSSLPQLKILSWKQNNSSPNILRTNQKQNILDIFGILKNSSILPLYSIKEIIVENPHNIKLVTTINNIKINIGMNLFEEKLNKLQIAMSEIQKNKKRIRTIDLRSPSKVVLEK